MVETAKKFTCFRSLRHNEFDKIQFSIFLEKYQSFIGEAKTNNRNLSACDCILHQYLFGQFHCSLIGEDTIGCLSYISNVIASLIDISQSQLQQITFKYICQIAFMALQVPAGLSIFVECCLHIGSQNNQQISNFFFCKPVQGNDESHNTKQVTQLLLLLFQFLYKVK